MSEHSKNFAQGAFVYQNEITGRNGTFVTHTITGDASKFCEWLMSIADNQGRFRLTMQERRERIPKKPTHNLYQDTWQPRQSQETPSSTHYAPRAEQSTKPDNLPF